MLKNLKGVIFDLDQTLLDSREEHERALREALKKFGLKRKKLEWIYGGTTEQIVKLNFPDLDERKVREIARVKHRLVELKRAKLLPYAKKLLAFLKRKGVKVGIHSQCTKDEIEKAIRAMKIEKYVDDYESSKRIPKPNPKTLFRLLKRLKLKRDEIIYVGDSIYDALLAKNAKVRYLINSELTGFEDPNSLPSLKEIYFFFKSILD